MPSANLLLSYCTRNLGDDIQTLAAKQFIDTADYSIDREFSDQSEIPDDVDGFLIANGWYSHFRDALPFPRNVTPFFISMHFANESFLTHQAGYLRRHAPIGCRDYSTYYGLKKRGVDVFYSGCMTLSFERHHGGRNGVLLVDVDPKLVHLIPTSLLEEGELITAHLPPTHRAPCLEDFARSFISRAAKYLARKDARVPARFAKQLLARKLLVNDSDRVEERREAAEALLTRYRTSSLVVTSRLHCALPCLAFGTPVVFLHSSPNDPRFRGLERLIRIYDGSAPIDWSPASPDLTAIQGAIRAICRESVSVRGNPMATGRGAELLRELNEAYRTQSPARPGLRVMGAV